MLEYAAIELLIQCEGNHVSGRFCDETRAPRMKDLWGSRATFRQRRRFVKSGYQNVDDPTHLSPPPIFLPSQAMLFPCQRSLPHHAFRTSSVFRHLQVPHTSPDCFIFLSDRVPSTHAPKRPTAFASSQARW